MTPPIHHPTREQWLRAAAEALIALFQIPPRGPWRVTCGWPSLRATAAQGRVLGQCWPIEASGDRTIELIVSISLDDPVEVLAVLVHEVLHSHLPQGIGHRSPFPRMARAMGLDGKPTATRPGDAFRAAIAPVLETLGRYPHAALDLTQRKKQSTRMIKAQCPDCGYTVRVARSWLQVALPHCPVDQVEMEAEGFPEPAVPGPGGEADDPAGEDEPG